MLSKIGIKCIPVSELLGRCVSAVAAPRLPHLQPKIANQNSTAKRLQPSPLTCLEAQKHPRTQTSPPPPQSLREKSIRETAADAARGSPPPPCCDFRLEADMLPPTLMIWEMCQVGEGGQVLRYWVGILTHAPLTIDH